MRHRLFPFLIAAVVVALDRLTKSAIKAHVGAYDTITVIPGLFNIVHTENPGAAFGFLAGSTASWRPLVLVCVVKGTEGEMSIRQNGVFAVNVLGAHQEEISRYFADSGRPRGWATFERIAHRRAATGRFHREAG